jgi:hypothetical protein
MGNDSPSSNNTTEQRTPLDVDEALSQTLPTTAETYKILLDRVSKYWV